MRGVTTPKIRKENYYDKFQLTRLMRGVTDNVVVTSVETVISTHTPHARRDRT